jgi:hypothetical protein
MQRDIGNEDRMKEQKIFLASKKVRRIEICLTTIWSSILMLITLFLIITGSLIAVIDLKLGIFALILGSGLLIGFWNREVL